MLRLLPGDQLNYRHSWFSEKNEKILYVFMEVKQANPYLNILNDL